MKFTTVSETGLRYACGLPSIDNVLCALALEVHCQ